MQWKLLSMVGVLGLVGCQVVPDRLPQAEPDPDSACHFVSEAADPLTAGVEVLTEWGFSLDASDTDLGLVSASRSSELLAYDPWQDLHGWYAGGTRVFGSIGLGSRGGFSTGVMLGYGGIGQRPTEVERVTLLVDENEVRVSRDIRRFDQLGDLREARSASDADFCQRLYQAMAAFSQEPSQKQEAAP
ncbi:hypothetical protein LG290_14250 [Halomonas sediminis]